MTSKYTYRHNELGGDWFADKDDMTVARLEVQRHPQVDRYTYESGERTAGVTDWDDDGSGYLPTERVTEIEPSRWEAREFDDEQKRLAHNNAGQAPLFQSDHQPARETVEGLYSARGHTQAAMTMLGMAQNFNHQQFGRSLEPAVNLSPYSAKLAGHAQKAGVVKPDFDVWASNDIGFDDAVARPQPKSHWTSYKDRDVPEGEVRRGRMTIRSIVGRRRAATQGQQGTLF
jgi:hypothetical protein